MPTGEKQANRRRRAMEKEYMTNYDYSTAGTLITGYEQDFAVRMGDVIRRTREAGRDPADWGLIEGRLESWLAAVERPHLFPGTDPAWLLDRLADTLAEHYLQLDADGCVPGGWDIDGKPRPIWHHWTPGLVCEILPMLGDRPAVAGIRDRLFRSAERVSERIIPYSRNEAPAWRGINLILPDIGHFHQVARFFGRDDWVAAAAAARDRILARQDRDEGWFPEWRVESEDRGPSSVYMEVTLHTLAQFVAAYPDSGVAARIARAVDWILRATYPNSWPIDTFDERERLHGDPVHTWHILPPFYVYSAGGRALLQARFARMQTHIPELATVLRMDRHFRRFNPEFPRILGATSVWHASEARYARTFRNRKSGLSVRRPWVMAGHGYLSGLIPPEMMWHRELQQHFSLYHDRCGVLFGGGNSVAEPEYSTLRVPPSYLCDEVDVDAAAPDRMTVLCRQRGWRIEIRAEANANECRIVCRTLARGEGEAFLQFPVCLVGSRKRLLAGGRVFTDFSATPARGVIRDALAVEGEWDGHPYTADIRFDSEAEAAWPLVPVNVRMPGRERMPFTQAVLGLSFKVQPDQPLNIRVKMR